MDGVGGAAASQDQGTGGGDPDLEGTDRAILDLLGVSSIGALPAQVAGFPP